jgi:hypothetical protein
MKTGINIENIIKDVVNETLKSKTIPDLPKDYTNTDNIGEVIEKLCILHIRTWFLEDMAGLAKSDEELANIKRKVDICFKQKRPILVQALNKMIDQCILTEKSLCENSVKIYKGIDDGSSNKVS